MHARWIVPPILALLALTACGRDDHESRVTGEPREQARSDVAGPKVGDCSLGAPRAAIEPGTPIAALSLAHGERGTTLVAAIDENTLEWVGLDTEGGAAVRARSSFPRARSLVAAVPWGARTVAFGHAPCPAGVDATSCLH
ncbi:MAG: hypothetical protein H5U40_05855, partial [Polyangiaceae bacterium]|nr:hypothetical protein [Polyangiaceae bacterium]